eukprot:1154429-Pelagomonas_calceolata.AAC.3
MDDLMKHAVHFLMASSRPCMGQVMLCKDTKHALVCKDKDAFKRSSRQLSCILAAQWKQQWACGPTML